MDANTRLKLKAQLLQFVREEGATVEDVVETIVRAIDTFPDLGRAVLKVARELEGIEPVQRSTVVDLPGRPVAAPCAISGCSYWQLEQLLAEAAGALLSAEWHERTDDVRVQDATGKWVRPFTLAHRLARAARGKPTRSAPTPTSTAPPGPRPPGTRSAPAPPDTRPRRASRGKREPR